MEVKPLHAVDCSTGPEVVDYWMNVVITIGFAMSTPFA
jgi:hypothetical protein